MINIERFIAIRKKRKFSQTELAQGICTQATLSRFENKGQVPTFKILSQLCQRLKIELGDITVSTNHNPITTSLNQAELAFINDDYSYVMSLLSQYQPPQIKYEKDRLHFEFLQGLYALRGQRDPMRASYYFKTIINTPHLKQANIYYLLALMGLGLAQEQENKSAQAQTSYEQLANLLAKVSFDSNLDNFRLIAMFYHSGNFFGKNKLYQQSNSLLRKAYAIGKQRHSTYYMAKILYRLGANDIRSGRIKIHTRQRLTDACAFARFNQNTVTLNRAKKLLQSLD